MKPRIGWRPHLAQGAVWLDSDRYDRRAWSDLTGSVRSIAQLIESGEALTPHFGALLEDLFAGLFKTNLVWRKPDAVRRAAALNRTILEQILLSPAFELLKNRTMLDEEKALLGAVAMSEQVLELIRSEKFINRREMLDLWDIKHQEEELDAYAAALQNADRLKEQENKAGEDEGAPPDAPEKENGALQKKIEELKQAAARAAQVAEARLNQKSRAFEEQLKHGDHSELKRLQIRTAQLAEEIDRAAQDSHDFGAEFGNSGRQSADERLELGRRLARNRRLGELARLVGRLKQEARALRRRTLDRGGAEAYDIERGDELGRLIPAELMAMRHPGLRADFQRRLLEHEILQYRLRQDEQKSKGPMIVCIDVSSSMQGDKELWAKAVSLTLMDIARRNRRLFRAVLFASGPESLKVLDLNQQRRYQPELPKVLEMAEYFPGGGTDFQAPLDAAVELLEDKQLKRGDIVVITDGECQVAPEWLAKFRERREELKFTVFAVLVDMGSSELSTLAQLSDHVTSVKQLTLESSREIFLKI